MQFHFLAKKENIMSEYKVEDYTEEREYNHYNGVNSMYGKIVNEQCKQQPRYCEPGEAGGEMEGEHRNTQEGP